MSTGVEQRQPICGTCRYDLTGNESGVCPECGTPIPGWPIFRLSERDLAEAGDEAGVRPPGDGHWHPAQPSCPAQQRVVGTRIQRLEPTPQARPDEVEQFQRALAAIKPLGAKPWDVHVCRTKDGYEFRLPEMADNRPVEFYAVTPPVLTDAFDRLRREERIAASLAHGVSDTTGLGKWALLALTLALGAATWPQVAPAEADLPPCHMFVLILVTGSMTIYLFHRDRKRRERSR